MNLSNFAYVAFIFSALLLTWGRYLIDNMPIQERWKDPWKDLAFALLHFIFKLRSSLILLACILLLWPAALRAQVYDTTYTNLPAYYGTLPLPATNQLTYQPPGLSSLAGLTNGWPTNAAGQTNQLIGTNYNGVGNTLGTNAVIDIRAFDEVVIGTSWTDYVPAGGTATGNTNIYTFGVSDDGIHFTPTNTPWFTWTVATPIGQTNGAGVLNFSRIAPPLSSWTGLPASTNASGAITNFTASSAYPPALGSIGFLQLQTIGVQGTNGETNYSFRAIGKARRSGTGTTTPGY